MKEINNSFKHLGNIRYAMRIVVNGNRYQSSNTSASPMWELEMYFKYSQLIEELRSQLCDGSNNNANGLQQYRNHQTTLEGFMVSTSKSVDSPIGTELKAGFNEARDRYLSSLTVSVRSKSDRRSHLNKWRDALRAIEIKAKVTPKPQLKQFNIALQQAMASLNMSQAELVAQANIPRSVVYHWLIGTKPNSRSLASIHRAELALGMNRDDLVNLVTNRSQLDGTIAPKKIEYRQRSSIRMTQRYSLLESEISPTFLDEWNDLFSYKTSEWVTLNRSKKGVWRLKATEKNGSLSKFACREGEGSASAHMLWLQMLSFMGFLRLAKIKGGWGLSTEEVQTLAWYAHPGAVQAYLEFVRIRSNGIRHSTHRRIAGDVISLTATTGFLWQQPTYMLKIPKNHVIPDMDWAAMCTNAAKVARRWKDISVEKSRRPEEPIAALLALSSPLDPLLRAIRHLDSEAAAMPTGGKAQARFKRDALLLAFLISNPLRALNLKIMKFSNDGTQHLYKTAGNQMRVRFSAQEMKTGKAYDVKIAGWLIDRIDEYLNNYRDVLLDGQQSDYFFVSSSGKSGKWESLSAQVYKITQRLIPETPGFGPHAVRHLVATDWLRQHPNDYLTLASLLNDRLETVLANYCHIKRDDCFDVYEKYLLEVINKSGNKI